MSLVDKPETTMDRTVLKMSKEDKKIAKKINKARHTLLKHDGVELAKLPTVHLVVMNGGLDNNITREDLLHVFNPHGEIVNITMERGKSYGFVSFASIPEAEGAMKHVNGKLIKASQGPTPALYFYVNYVSQVPGVALPADDLPPGLILIKDFITKDEENLMLSSVDWDAKDSQSLSDSKGSLKHRRVKHYGYEFLYGINNVDRSKPLEQGIPDWCNPVLERLQQACFISARPDQLTVNQYLPGQGIPAHIDTHSAFEDGLCSLSLGSQVVMEFRHPDGRHHTVVLPRRSILVMTGESRYLWTHGITPRKSDIIPDPGSPGTLTLMHRETRTSFTFRKILHSPCKCAFPQQCDSQKEGKKNEEDKAMPSSAAEAQKMESEHVHKVYEEIAGHFSDTRHSPWPKVTEFLKQQPEGAFLADIGCGNGKYLAVQSNAYKLGCDRSWNLCSIVKERGFPVFVCDCLHVPLRDSSQDTVISIAVVHHLSTPERRLAAVKEVVRVLKAGGQGLIYVWALEQKKNNVKSKYLKKSNPTSAVSEESQVNADYEQHSEIFNKPSVAAENVGRSAISTENSTPEGQIATDVQQKLTVHCNRTEFQSQDLLVPWHLKDKHTPSTADDAQGSQCFHRYYHVFREGELEELISQIPEIQIRKSYYDQGNWCVIFEKTVILDLCK